MNELAAMWTVIKSGGWAAAFLIVMAFVARDYLREWLVSGLKHENDLALEAARAEFARDSAAAVERVRLNNEQVLRTQSAIVSAAAGGHSAALARRMDAMQGLWNALVKARKAMPIAVGMTELMLDEEIVDAFVKKDPRFQHGEFELTVEELVQGNRIDAETQGFRVMAGEYLYALFAAYHTFILRVAVVFHFRLEHAKTGTPSEYPDSWKDDPIIKEMAEALLSKDELSRFGRSKVGGASLVLSAIERKFVSAVDMMLTGHQSAEEMGRQTRRLNNATESMPDLAGLFIGKEGAAE